MATNYSPKIITDGLVLSLDAADKNSYPGSGTAWSDLSPNGNDGTLTNGPTFDSGHGGSIVFDGTNDYISLGVSFISTGEIGDGDISYTMEAWFNYSGTPGATTSGWSLIGNAHSYGIGMQLMGNYINFGYRSNSNFYSTGALSSGNWYHVVCTREAGNATYLNRIYLNGQWDSTYNTSNYLYITDTSDEMQIGWADTRITGRYNGNIAVVKLYNTFLTDAQVKQNFNAQRSRFGV
jgi:hypothetical protein